MVCQNEIRELFILVSLVASHKARTDGQDWGHVERVGRQAGSACHGRGRGTYNYARQEHVLDAVLLEGLQRLWSFWSIGNEDAVSQECAINV